MRTFLIGLIGGALVFAFFWYRGDIGCVPLGGAGELCPPQETPLLDRLRALQEAERAIYGSYDTRTETIDTEALAARANLRDGAARFYAGQLITAPLSTPTASAQGAGAARSAAAGGGIAQAMETAWQIGDVSRIDGSTMIVALDFDISEEDFQEEGVSIQAVEPERATRRFGGVVSGFSSEFSARGSVRGSARGMAQSSRAVMNAVAARRPRLYDAQRARTCPDNPTQEFLDANTEAAVACAVERLEASGQFEYVELDYLITHEMMSRPQTVGVVGAPDDPLFGLQWHFRNNEDTAGGGAGFTDFWSREAQPGSSDVVVAVIDTGLVYSHPEIVDSPNIADGVDMVSVAYYENNDGIPGRDRNPNDPGDACPEYDGPYAEDSFHGTHVSGTVGAVATDDGDGIAGGAWQVTVVPIRALGRCGGLASDIIDSIRWAVGLEPAYVNTLDGGVEEYWNPNPADIINLSLGFVAESGCPRSMQDAIDDATAQGAIVVAAAGNLSRDVSQYAPAGCRGVITVAAGDGAGELAGYSNYGEGVDIMGPGGDLLADADADGRPDGVLSIKPARNCRDPLNNTVVEVCDYAYENGTSMAAPHVSAAFALLRAEYPRSSNEELISLILDTARSPRSPAQCAGDCATMTGGTPIDGEPGQCFRPCGTGLMDLARAVRN